MSNASARPRLLRLLSRYFGEGVYSRVGRRRGFDRHLRRTLARFGHDGPGAAANPNVLALLAVESFFRPRSARLVEYATWMLASLPPRRWLGRLTVGIAQARLEHWDDLGLIDGLGFSPGRLARVADPAANYGVCLRYLEQRGAVDTLDVVALTRTYVGAARPEYTALLERARAGAMAVAA